MDAKKCFLVKYKNAEMEKLRIDSYTKMIIWRTPQLKKNCWHYLCAFM